ncbi:MAG: tetratricopeptide repeat protein, partial [Coriobacteriaceae bacterium]|nr:tetratricopeptide repeat protein [Coriobacteriaceae bacterium]
HHVFFHFSVDGEMGSSERLWRRLLGFFGGDATGSGEIGVDDIGVWLRKHPLDCLTFVVVDDAARFAGHQDVRARLLSLSEMDENLVVICASDTSPHTWRGASVELEPLTQQQVRMIAYQYFHRYGKTIEDEYLKLLCSNETLRNPLFLKCLLNEQRTALSFDGFEAAFRRLSSLCGFDELVGSIGMRLSDQLHDLGVGDSSVWFAMRVLASVKGGLYEEEILSCSGILPLAWSLVRAAFQPVLREYDGLWSVANSVIRDAFAATSLHHLPGIDGVAHERLVGLFSSQGVTARSTDELAYQHLVTGDEDALLELLGSSSRIAVLAAERRESLVAYLTKVQGRSDELAGPIAGGLEDAFPSPEAFGNMLLALNDAGCYRAVAKLSSLLKPKMPLPEGCDLALVMNEARAEYKMGAAHYSDAAILYDEASRLAAEFDRDTMLPLLAEILFKRAIVEKSSGYPDRARRSYEDAVGIYRTLGIEDGNASWAMGNLASLLYLFGEDERSRKLFDEAVRLRIRAFGERSPEV